MTDQFDYEAFKQAAIKGLYEGKPLTGENGLFAPMLKHLLETALEGEMDSHLLQTRQTEQNRRNGKNTKTRGRPCGQKQCWPARIDHATRPIR